MDSMSPRGGWLETAGLHMHYLDWDIRPGSTEQQYGTTVLALHGLASSCHWYDLVIPQMDGAYRFIVPDQRGHGQTDHPPTGYDWQTVASDAIYLLDQLGLDRAALMGHSWGANVAMAVAAIYPDRVSSLVLIDGGFFDWTLWPGANWESFRQRFRPRDVSGTRQEFLDRLHQQLEECWSDQLEQIVMSMVRVGADGQVRDILEPTNHAQVMEAMWNEPSSVFYSRVECPTLIVAAGRRQSGGNPEFARMRQEMATAAQAAIRECRVEWIPDTIHDIGYHKPMDLARVLRSFLGGP